MLQKVSWRNGILILLFGYVYLRIGDYTVAIKIKGLRNY